MCLVKIHFPIAPVPKARARTFHDRKTNKVRSFTPTPTKVFETTIKKIARFRYREQPLTVPLKVEIVVSLQRPVRALKREYPSVKPDIDNYTKALLDALEGVLWKNDSLICDCRVVKVYGRPGITVQVSEMP